MDKIQKQKSSRFFPNTESGRYAGTGDSPVVTAFK
jgi:hypothetical protein